MKFLMFSDLHLGVHNNNSLWLDLSIKLIKEVIDECKKKNIKDIVFLGDFFHERRSINVKTINYGLQIADLFKENEIEVYLILGNHDCYLKNDITPNSLNIFNKYKNIHVVTECIELDDKVSLVGWKCDIGKAKTPILFGHFGIEECLNVSSENILCEYSLKSFSNFKKVYSGHFHFPLKMRNIEYIGSVFPFTFADINSPRGYYIYDTDEDSYQFIEFTEAPKYKIFFIDDKINPEEIEGNFVKIICNQEISKSEIDKIITQYNLHNPVSVTIDFSKIQLSEARDLDETITIKSNIEIFDEFIDKIKSKRSFPKHLESDILKKIVHQLYTESVTDEGEENE